jgi:hypothetical protein
VTSKTPDTCVALCVLVLLAAIGCAPSTPITSDGAPTDSEDTSTLGTSAVDGQIIDLSGAPVVAVFVTISDDYCVPDRSSATGSFTVEKVKDGSQRVITYGETASNGWFASVVLPIDIAGDTTLVDPVQVPRLDERHPIDLATNEQQVIVSGDGLRLFVEPGTLTLAPFFEDEILVARVPIAAVPPFVPPGVELLDLHVLHPIRSTFEPPAAIQFPPNPELTPGTPVIFHSLDYDTGLLAPVATGIVNAEGAPVTNPGEGIPELTWIGVSLE